MHENLLPIASTVILEFLAATEFFKGMNPRILKKLVPQLKPRLLAGGEMLIEQGNIGDSLYLVVNGRLRAFKENEQHQLVELGEMGTGDIIGELALLSELPRAASVCAIRDSLVLELTQEKFNRFMQTYPEQLTHITKHAIQRLLKNNHSTSQKITTIAIAPAGNSHAHHQFTQKFISILSEFGTTLHLSSKTFDNYYSPQGSFSQTALTDEHSSQIAHWLNEQETKYAYIVYETDQINSAWTKRCVRQADRILLVADSSDNPTRNEIEVEIDSLASSMRRSTDLILIQKNHHHLPKNTSRWLKNRFLTSHLHYRDNYTPDLKRIIRFISGKAYALVLGGGGARGLAHFGVYRALKELNIPIDLVGGTSAGAMIGAIIAMDLNEKEFYEVLHKNLVDNNKLFDYTVPVVSLLAAKSWTQSLKNSFGKDVCSEDLWLPYFAVSTNISKREICIHEQGPLWKNIRCSLSLPGIVPPVSMPNGDLFIDGGILNNLPVDIMRKKANGGTIIAVNVASIKEITCSIANEGWLSGWPLLGNRMNPFKKTSLSVPNIAEIIFESISLCSINHSKKMAREADHYIELSMGKYGLFDFKFLDELAEIGYTITLEKLQHLSYR
ncbi:MAG: patatin-like phospholipase family protein [Legionellales bacterium]|nr:patatin-like phospholipase family protein [Legionellales bacterium]